ncbi:phage tail spike protein [Alkaliphilus transvaalensis]|uniref:phage tail spike protein n=1 Tax=Alkaliphilus transvaalensis TaxID=114628 RepID=UPI00068429EF|nr:phage tail spike protein [Alkaliphilus transvaalensis]
MIIVYDKRNVGLENFESNGLGILNECIKAETTEELNGEYSLYLEYPADLQKAKHLMEFNIIKADNQLFRIYKVEREQETTRKIKVWARHISYDLAFYFIEAVNLINANMKEALEGMIPPEAQAIFSFKAPEKNIYPVRFRNFNALEGVFRLLEIYGGELIRDNYHVEVVEERGRETGVSVKYGKNLKGLKAIIDTSEFATRIYPMGENDLILPERYVEADSSVINLLPYPVTRKVEFSGVKDQDELRELANEYIKKISNPFVNVKVDFLELSKTDEYSAYHKLIKLELGDTVKVEHERLGIHAKLRVIKIVKDLLQPIHTIIELGNSLNTIVNQLDFSHLVQRLESRIEGSQNAVILKKNSDALTITSTSFYAAIAVGISALADTNLTCNLLIHASASDDLTLYMKFSLDGNYYEFQPNQHVARGENVISLTIPMPQVTAGQHAFVVELQTSNGVLNIDKNNLQVMIEGRHLEGGLSPSLPRAEVMQFILYSLFSNKIKSYKSGLEETVTLEAKPPEMNFFSQSTTYEEMLQRKAIDLDTITEINMKIIGISQIADESFFYNLICDEWIKHFSEFQEITPGIWGTDQYITIQEKRPVTIGSSGEAIGGGVLFTVNFSDPNLYRELIDFELEVSEG